MNKNKGYVDIHCTILTIFKNKKLGKAMSKQKRQMLSHEKLSILHV